MSSQDWPPLAAVWFVRLVLFFVLFLRFFLLGWSLLPLAFLLLFLLEFLLLLLVFLFNALQLLLLFLFKLLLFLPLPCVVGLGQLPWLSLRLPLIDLRRFLRVRIVLLELLPLLNLLLLDSLAFLVLFQA